MYQNSLDRISSIGSMIREAVDKSIFPIETNDRILYIESMDKINKSEVYDASFNVKNHLDAKLKGRDLTLPVKATLVLKEKATGKIIDRAKVTLLDQPIMTNRGTFLYGGNDYHMVNQLRLKPGIYTRIKDNGEVESFFNLSKGGTAGLAMWLDPESSKLKFKIGGQNPSLYAVMKALDVSDTELKNKWGQELFEVNKMTPERLSGEISKVYESLYRSKAEPGLDIDTQKSEIKRFFENTGLSEDTTKITLGQAFDKITPEALLRTSDKLIKVSKQEAEPDERDSLVFKNIMAVEDLLGARVTAKSREIQNKIKNNLNSKDSIRDIYTKEFLNKPLRSFLTQSSLSTSSDQTNPIAMANALTRTTLLGEGGISSLDIVTTGMRAVSNSHMGALDPSQTPESKRIGVNLNLAKAVEISDNEIKSPLLNLKTDKVEMLSKLQTYDNKVALPDQYDKATRKFNFPKARVLFKGKIVEVPPAEVEYVLRDASDMFSLSSNLMPFQASVQGNRAMMGNKMFGQAISLKDREAPLVQVKRMESTYTPEGIKIDTEEKAAARIFSVKAPVSGTVKSITADYAEIEPEDGGKAVKVYRYDHFPLANKAFMHSEFIVKIGDKVKAGQAIAEDNFTKDNTLALGTNLNIAYLPFKDKTFEDGFVISESAAKKLTSQHQHSYKTSVGPKDKLGVSSYLQQFPMAMTPAQKNKLDENGIIKVGEIVEPGDTLVALLHYREPSETDIALGKLSKTLMSKYADGGIKYDHDTVGRVDRVANINGEIIIHVSTEKEAEDGDKIVGRYGNKGIITSILPDDEMPISETGVRADVVTSPYGVPGRINTAQIYETIAAKAAIKKGSPIKITNMDPNIKSNVELENLAKRYGVKTSEKMYDPKTGRLFAETSFGPQYMLKLTHTVDKKMISRGPYAAYNSDEQPAKGSGTSARALDRLTWNAMIAHGARDNLLEMSTFKASKNPELWNKIRLGLPIPTPKTPFSTDKLFSLMQAAGINVKKDGQQMMLTPMTDDEILSKSNGAIDDAQVMMAKTLRPIKDGLFDDAKTGGLNGKKWTHIELHEPVVSPIMAPAAAAVLNVPVKKFESILTGNTFIDPVTRDTSADKKDGYLTGGMAIKTMLAEVDPKVELDSLRKESENASGDKLDKLNKRMRYLKALVDTGKTPEQAYVVNNIPVLPPHMRPIYSLPDGSLSTSPINFLYRDLIMVNKELKASEGLPEFAKKKLREDLFSAARAVQGLGDPIIARGEKKVVGALETIKGDQPKEGYFQAVAFSKKQELTGQSTVAPSVDVSPDEVMLPKAMGWNIFEPFIHRELTKMGYSNMQAKQMIQNKDPRAEIAMERVAENRPVWVNRAPSLHKLSMLAMMPKLWDGSSIKVNPLVVGGYTMDFDGDSVGIYVPVTHSAVEESKKFMPSKILDDPRDYSVTLRPSHDMQLGLFAVSTKGAKKPDAKFNSLKEAEQAFLRNEINLSDIVTISGYETTFGREKLKEVLPAGVAIPDTGIDKSKVDAFLREVASKDPQNVNRRYADITRVAAEYVASAGIGLTLKDVQNSPEFMKPFKDKIKKEFSQLDSTGKVKFLENMVGDFNKAGKEWIKNNVWKNNLATMSVAAGKPGLDSVKQLKFAPLAVMDEKGRMIPSAITRSYSDGITASDYWIASFAARKGMIDRALQTAEPGYFAKQLISVAVDQVVSEQDCGTKNGVELPLTRNKMDILWRYGADDGVLIDNKRYEELLRSGKPSIKVRSPITCEANEGVCQKCYGSKANGSPIEIGANVGTEAGQVATERTTQLTMKTFHCLHRSMLVLVRLAGAVRLTTLRRLWDCIDADALLNSAENQEEKLASGLEVFNNGSWTPVDKIIRHKRHAESPMVMVRSADNRFVVSQDNHPHMISVDGVEAAPTQASELDLAKDNYMYYDFPVWAEDKIAPEVDPYFAGIFASEGGYCGHMTRGKFVCNGIVLSQNTDSEIYESCVQHMSALASPNDLIINMRRRPGGKEHAHIKRYGRELGDKFARIFGIGSADIGLPEEFVAYSDEDLHKLLCGVVDGDGCVLQSVSGLKSGRGAISIEVASLLLIQQLALICRKFGLTYRVNVCATRALTRNQTYKLMIYPKAGDEAIFSHSEKLKSKSIQFLPENRKTQLSSNVNYVKEIYFNDITDHVYDLTTRDHTYSVNGVWTHNTGSVATSGPSLASGFDKLQQLSHFPDFIKDRATLARLDGIVTDIKPNPAGGMNVFIGDERHFCPVSQLKVKIGDKVSKGDALSEGAIKPQELLATKGIRATQDFLIDEMQKTFTDQNVPLNRRSFETVVRATTNVTKIIDPAGSEYLPGDTVQLTKVLAYNRLNPTKPIIHEPELLGIDFSSKVTDDWMAKLNTNRIQSVLQDAVASGGKSYQHSYNPVAPYIMGSEFGKGEKGKY